jgi:hypothetical protein
MEMRVQQAGKSLLRLRISGRSAFLLHPVKNIRAGKSACRQRSIFMEKLLAKSFGIGVFFIGAS